MIRDRWRDGRAHHGRRLDHRRNHWARLDHGLGRKFVREPIAIVVIGLVMTALFLEHP